MIRVLASVLVVELMKLNQISQSINQSINQTLKKSFCMRCTSCFQPCRRLSISWHKLRDISPTVTSAASDGCDDVIAVMTSMTSLSRHTSHTCTRLFHVPGVQSVLVTTHLASWLLTAERSEYCTLYMYSYYSSVTVWRLASANHATAWQRSISSSLLRLCR